MSKPHPAEREYQFEPFRLTWHVGLLCCLAMVVFYLFLLQRHSITLMEFVREFGHLFFIMALLLLALPFVLRVATKEGLWFLLVRQLDRFVQQKLFLALFLITGAIGLLAYASIYIANDKYDAALKLLGQILVVICGSLGSIAFGVTHIWAKHLTDDDSRDRALQKERVRVLTTFSPQAQSMGIMTKRNVYDHIIGMLHRATSTDSNRAHGKHEVCLLLCTPLFDYSGNPKSSQKDIADQNSLGSSKQHWGFEFHQLLKALGDKALIDPDLSVSFAFLSQHHAGFRPLSDFHEVLARFIAEGSKGDLTEDTCLAHLHQREKLVISDGLLSQSNTEIGKSNARFRTLDHLVEIPFQMCLIVGADRNEAIICFAGREVLEQGDESKEAQGLYTSDPFVVETLHRVYKTYVEVESRTDFIPDHTKRVMGQQKRLSATGAYDLKGVLGRPNVNLKVNPDVFSPVVGNSSKFSAWCVAHHLSKGDTKVLEIGAGTGILSRVAYDCLLELHSNDTLEFSLTAMEPTQAGFENVQINRPMTAGTPATNFVTYRGGMFVVPKSGGAAVFASNIDTSGYNSFEDAVGSIDIFNVSGALPTLKVGAKLEFGEYFDLVIADLPFTNAKHTDDPTTHAYFDYRHREQSCLFKLVAENVNLLSSRGRVLTSFSSLGGMQDVVAFERMFEKFGLRAVVRHDFMEAGFAWYVYLLVKQSQFENETRSGYVPNSYWDEQLGIRKSP